MRGDLPVKRIYNKVKPISQEDHWCMERRNESLRGAGVIASTVTGDVVRRPLLSNTS
jgi:hypothetical protein